MTIEQRPPSSPPDKVPLSAGSGIALDPGTVKQTPLTPSNPFAPAESAGQVAGLGKAFRPLFRRFTKDASAETAEQATERGIAEALDKARTSPTLTPGPKGPYPGYETEIRTGTTRPLPNTDYFNSYETRQVLSLLEKNAARKVAGPVQTHAQTQALAAERATVAAISGRKPSLNWAPEDLTALRNSLESQTKEVYGLSEELMALKRNGGTPTDDQLAQFELASQRLVATNNAVAGLSSEAGRLLNALRITATDTGQQVRAMAEIVSQGGGPENILERVGAVHKTGGAPGKVSQAVEDTWGQKLWNTLLTVRYNMMLSSIRTHGANIAGSTATGLYEQTIINPLATLFNLGERGLRRARGGEFTLPDDMPVQAMASETLGLLRGAQDGLKLARDIALGREVPAESMQGKFITESGMRYRPQDQPSTMAGKALTLPTRMLEAEDAFFRSTYYQARLQGLARSRAMAESGGDPKRADEIYRTLVETPPDDMRAAAREYSQKLTFTNDPNLYGKTLGSLANGVAQSTQAPAFRLLVPFVRTPANLFGYALEAAGLQAITKPSMTAQAILKGTPRERAEAFARTTAGAGLMMALWESWASGNITGAGSTNYQHVKLMESTGWRANAVRIGDTFYELNRLDPLGLTLATVASIYEIQNDPNMAVADKTTAIAGGLLQLGDLMMDRHYLASVGDLFNAMQRGPGGAGQFTALGASTLTSMWLPNIARDFREASDPFRREQAFDLSQPGAGIQTRIWKNVWNALPGYSKKLPVALDWRGKPIMNDGHYLVRGFVPVRMGDVKDVPASTRELLRNGIVPSRVRSQMTAPNASGMLKLPLLSLDDGRGFVYSYYQQLVGELRDAAVSRVVESKQYQRHLDDGNFGNPDTLAGEMLRKELRRASLDAQERFLKELNEGKTVTLYKGHGDAEVKVQLPMVDRFDMRRAIREYRRATPEERTAPEPLIATPPGGISNPALERIVGF